MYKSKNSYQIQNLKPCSILLRSSFVITAICKDGIIVASESRANIFDKTDKERKPIAYFDCIQKTFPIGPFAIAETGQGLILNVFFSEIVNQFTKAISRNLRIHQLLPTFIEYCKKQCPPSAFEEIKKQKLFSVGYIDEHPLICFFNQDQPTGQFGCIRNSGMIESDRTLMREHADQLLSLSAEDAALLTKKAIETYASEGDRWKTIGGPIDILLVNKNECRWIEKNSPNQKWKYIQDMIKEYKDGDLELNVIPPSTKEILDKLIDTAKMG